MTLKELSITNADFMKAFFSPDAMKHYAAIGLGLVFCALGLDAVGVGVTVCGIMVSAATS